MGTVEAIAVGVSRRRKVHGATLSAGGETKIHGTRNGVVVVVTLRGERGWRRGRGWWMAGPGVFVVVVVASG